MYNRLFGEVHIKLADTLTAMGAANMDMELYEEAQPHFEKAMVLYAELLGPDCTQKADCHSCKVSWSEGLVFDGRTVVILATAELIV